MLTDTHENWRALSYEHLRKQTEHLGYFKEK